MKILNEIDDRKRTAKCWIKQNGNSLNNYVGNKALTENGGELY